MQEKNEQPVCVPLPLALLEAVFEAAVETDSGAGAFSLSSEIVPISREFSKVHSEHAAVVARLIKGLIRTAQKSAASRLIETELDPNLSKCSAPAQYYLVLVILGRSLWRLGM